MFGTGKLKPAGKRPSAYAKHREKSALKQAAQSRAGRDIGPLPKVANPKRRAKAAASFDFFCRTYFPQTFHLPWSKDHLDVIAKVEQIALPGRTPLESSGDNCAYALPRGSGKTSLAEAATIWVLLYGYASFPVVIGSDETSASALLDSIKTELESNDLLLEDFPEVCYPIRALEGIPHRCGGQLLNGERTHIQWTAKEVVLPTIPNSKASGAAVAVTGITGRIRGMKIKTASGKSIRPDFGVVDDPQTDESAKSPSQCADRIRIIRGAVMGLAGPGKKLRVIMPCTVINPGDMADQMLDREKHPEWQGVRAKLIYSFPKNETLWEEYRKLRAESLRSGAGGTDATKFYEANRAAMDEGATAAWPERFNSDEISAVQNAMNLRYDLGDGAFFSEYQNEPLPLVQPDTDALTADQVASKINGLDRGSVPTSCNRVVAFIDVQKTVMYWTVAAFEDDFTGYVLDYGSFPDQHREHFSLSNAKQTLQRWASANGRKNAGLEEIIYAGLEHLTGDLLSREWKRDDGAALKIERMPIDANWGESSDVIYKFCGESTHGAILIPSHGRGVGAKNRPFSEYHRKRGDRVGLNWRMPAVGGRRSVRYLIHDANWWKSFLHKRLAVPPGGRGRVTMFGRETEPHRMFAEHVTAETPVAVTVNGKTIVEWTLPTNRPDNHFLDCLVGCCVAASVQGATLTELRQMVRRVETVKLSELRKNAKRWTANRS